MKNCFIICFQSKPMTRSICTIRLINYQGSSLFIQIYQSSICNYTLWNFFPHHISTFSSNNILFTHQLFSIKFRRFLDIASINSNRHAVAYPLPSQVQMKSGSPTTRLIHFIRILYYWNMSYTIFINFIISDRKIFIVFFLNVTIMDYDIDTNSKNNSNFAFINPSRMKYLD